MAEYGPEYWNERWKGSDPYEAGWAGDKPARQVELWATAIGLLSHEENRIVVDVGCGAFTLDESPGLLHFLRRHSYVGIDVSPVALDKARLRLHAAEIDYRTIQCDLNQELPNVGDEPGMFVVARRVVQNLRYEEQRRVLAWLFRFPHGLVVEQSGQAYRNLNTYRWHRGLAPLPMPSHNEYLTNSTIRDVLDLPGNDKVRCRTPLSRYYYRTRVLGEPKDINTFDKAEADSEPEWVLGPTFFSW